MKYSIIEYIFVLSIRYGTQINGQINTSQIMTKFKQEILKEIRVDINLFAAVSQALKIKPESLIKSLRRNGKLLNQYHVVELVANYLKKDVSEIVEAEELTGV